MLFDAEVKKFYKNRIKQVFVYLTNHCQLRCKQCLYKPILDNSSSDLEFSVLLNLLTVFHDFGAFKVSYLGGEPTLYNSQNKTFSDVVSLSHDLGYEYVRVDTNGQFSKEFLEDKSIRLLNEITFSLDGHDESTNDAVRGLGSFKKCVANIQKAVYEGYKVQITSCIHSKAFSNKESAVENMEKIISFAEELGVDSINFHPILKVGAARDEWISDTDISPALWTEIYKVISDRVQFDEYAINVRIPTRYISDYDPTDMDFYNYCPLKMGERALIMPDGQIKVCAFTIGTDYCIARFDKSKIKFEKHFNELDKLDENRICCNQSSYDGLEPLCMSFKPNQEELVWNSIRLEGKSHALS